MRAAGTSKLGRQKECVTAGVRVWSHYRRTRSCSHLRYREGRDESGRFAVIERCTKSMRPTKGGHKTKGEYYIQDRALKLVCTNAVGRLRFKDTCVCA